MAETVIWGTEARHTWKAPPGTGSVVATLNKTTDDATGLVPQFPRVKLLAVGGLHGLGDPSDNADIPVGTDGEYPRISQRRGKTITYEGWVEARTLPDFRAHDLALRVAFFDQSTEGRVDVTPHPLACGSGKTWAAGATAHYFARALGLEIGNPLESDNLYRATFLLALRNHSGLYYDQSDATHH